MVLIVVLLHWRLHFNIIRMCKRFILLALARNFWATVTGRVTAKVVLNVVHLWKTLWIFDISTVVLVEPKFDVIKPMQMHFCTSQWMKIVLGHTVFRWCMHNIPTTQWKMHRIQFWLSNMIESSMCTVQYTCIQFDTHFSILDRNMWLVWLLVLADAAALTVITNSSNSS